MAIDSANKRRSVVFGLGPIPDNDLDDSQDRMHISWFYRGIAPGEAAVVFSIDVTSRYANLKDSVKKYITDNITQYQLTFDPNLSHVSGSSNAWVATAFKGFNMKLGLCMLEIYCCSRSDADGFNLDTMVDNVTDIFHDTSSTDGIAKFPLYRSSATQAWTVISNVASSYQGESRIELDDGTKVSVINILLRWGSK